jgi:hypothetical protein
VAFGDVEAVAEHVAVVVFFRSDDASSTAALRKQALDDEALREQDEAETLPIMFHPTRGLTVTNWWSRGPAIVFHNTPKAENQFCAASATSARRDNVIIVFQMGRARLPARGTTLRPRLVA